MQRVQVHDWHAQRARMGEFAGWEMPLWYEGAIAEHMAVRDAVGLFDISHMGQLLLSGPSAIGFANAVVTSDIARMPVGRAKYTCLCNERGALKDDIVVYRTGPEDLLLLVNAVNKDKDLAWLTSLLRTARALGASVPALRDATMDYAFYAIQGPRAMELARSLGVAVPGPLFAAAPGKVDGVPLTVSHTGYTGEEGFELLVPSGHPHHPDPDKRRPAKEAKAVFDAVLAAGKPLGLAPIGLFARDTLRIEAGYILYGDDAWERQVPASRVDDITPHECGLGFLVTPGKKGYVGCEALEEMAGHPGRTLANLRLSDRGIPRPHCRVYAGERDVGEVTSGTMSPVLKMGIALALVDPSVAAEGTRLVVDVRGKRLAAEVVPKPFYDPARHGRTRAA